MNGGVTVVLCIVGALALCEAVLPRALAALRRRRQDQANAAPSTGEGVPRAENEAVVQCPTSSVREAGSGQRTEDRGQRQDARSAKRGARGAKRAVRAAIPPARLAFEDLASVYEEAKLGKPEALAWLGDYAYRRGVIVEAFYWTILAELRGADGLDETLCEMRTRWLSEGCPPEFENAYAEFTEEQGEFARAVLRLQCDVDPQCACALLEELAERGVVEARLFLGETTPLRNFAVF